MTVNQHSCVVVGAGMSGLMAARTLQAGGVRVKVLDKGRGVGGRLATRRSGVGVFDHGAQFFTVRDENFQRLVDELIDAGIVSVWCRGFADETGAARDDGHPRYFAHGGMTAMAKYLARGLDVQTGVRITALTKHVDDWELIAESGETWRAGNLILTSPVPQSLQLLATRGIALPSKIGSALEAITYDPCIALLVLLDAGTSGVPEPGGVKIARYFGDANASPAPVEGEPLAWLADNHRKGISPDASAVTIHAGPDFSRAHFAEDDETVTQLIIEAASLRWIDRRKVREAQVKRWRYSKPVHVYPERCLMIPELSLAFAGDAFGAPRIEGAALSGLAVADVLLKNVT
ncbi:MAG: FAD-dependent oxidoreductase [Acidobacteriota bacterium]|nr:FAD-dependent oxidoreductase [Acidobacteriota bacterium]